MRTSSCTGRSTGHRNHVIGKITIFTLDRRTLRRKTGIPVICITQTSFILIPGRNSMSLTTLHETQPAGRRTSHAACVGRICNKSFQTMGFACNQPSTLNVQIIPLLTVGLRKINQTLCGRSGPLYHSDTTAIVCTIILIRRQVDRNTTRRI